jgi:excisionase family DNA binding protein
MTAGRLEAAVSELVAAITEQVRTDLRDGGPPVLLSVDEAARRLGIGRTALYGAIRRGHLRTVLVGRRRLVPVDGLAEFAGNGADGCDGRARSALNADAAPDGDGDALARMVAPYLVPRGSGEPDR